MKKHKETKKGELFLRKTVKLEHGEGYFAIYATDADLVRMANTTRWFADSTFKIVPRMFYQLMTIICLIEDKFAVLSCFVLMSHKTGAMYEAVFAYLKEEMLRMNRSIALRTVTTDFELAELNSFKSTFNINIVGCHFHYCQAVIRKVGEMGFWTDYVQVGSPIRKSIRRLLALPLLRSDLIPLAFAEILKDAPMPTTFLQKV